MSYLWVLLLARYVIMVKIYCEKERVVPASTPLLVMADAISIRGRIDPLGDITRNSRRDEEV